MAMEAKVLPLQRPSLGRCIEELKENAHKMRGAIVIWVDESEHYRISGFPGQTDRYLICGLLDWIKADVLTDVTCKQEYVE